MNNDHYIPLHMTILISVTNYDCTFQIQLPIQIYIW